MQAWSGPVTRAVVVAVVPVEEVLYSSEAHVRGPEPLVSRMHDGVREYD